MRLVLLAALAFIALSLHGWADEPDKTPQPEITPGTYVIANSHVDAKKYYGDNGSKVKVALKKSKVTFSNLTDFAFQRTPEFERKDGKYVGHGNLLIHNVVEQDGVLTIKCHACYIGSFDLRRIDE